MPVVIALHNQLFDCAFLHAAGTPIKPTRRACTLTMSHLFDPIIPHGLKSLASRFVRGLDYPEQELHKRMAESKWDWDTVPVELPEYWKYGAIDAIITARLWRHFNIYFQDHARQETRDLLDIEMASQQAIEHMGYTGMKIDYAYTKNLDLELQTYTQTMRDWGKHTFDLNMRSRRDVHDALILQGWKPTKFTEKGNVKMDADALKEIADDFPLARAYMDMKHAEKMQSTYTRRFLELMDDDRILHPRLNPNGASTGRMTSEKPNLQQLPTTNAIRNCFISRDDHSLIFADYDSIELRMFARYTQCPDMIAASSADDPHWATSLQIWPDKDPAEMITFPGDTVSKSRRNLAKALTYTLLYGAGAKTFAETSGLPFQSAEQASNQYHAAFPAIGTLSTTSERNLVGLVRRRWNR